MADLTQADVDRLAAITLAKSTEINAAFAKSGRTGFADWFNANLGGKPPFVRPSGDLLKMPTTPESLARFDSFWDGLQNAFDRPRITALDFAALMCIVLNETAGEFWANPEKIGKSTSANPGLAYPFDKIVGKKKSYNHANGNRTAGTLFNDADFIKAHRRLALGETLAGHGDDFDGKWHSESYPRDLFPTEAKLDVTGFIMQADFYKFRGRGVIQVTGRAVYEPCVAFIQAYAGADPTLIEFKRRWSGLKADVAATISTNDDWDKIFATGDILATAIKIHAGLSGIDYRKITTNLAVLTERPEQIDPPKVPRGQPGSIYYMGRCISGSYDYAANTYRDRVLTLLQAMP